MADVKFTVTYEINTGTSIPSPRAIVTMKVKADEDGCIPTSVRCMDLVLMEPMTLNWGSPHEEAGWRTRKIPIESESWPAVTARVEENILQALARMQEADARYQKLIAEQPADYVYETSVPGPASSGQFFVSTGQAPYSEDEKDEEIDPQVWAMQTFGLSQLPCESASNFLSKNFVYIARYAEEAYGVWRDLSADQRYHAGIEWLVEYAEADDDDGDAYPIADWIDWAKKHRA